ncbi:MAG: hypothetical protein ACRD8O_07235 [Bryobacteraceae bacterium]
MAFDLLTLLGKFKNLSNRETDAALFRTKVPSVGPDAYLNIVYKPAAAQVRTELARELQFSSSLSEFYQCWNGARFFVGALSVYGCLPVNYQIVRSDPLKLLPFSIREVNREFSTQMKERDLVCVGSYSYDRSVVCICRKSQSVTCFVGKDFSKERQSWSSLDHWLSDELLRLSALFDESGDRLVEKDKLLPGLEPWRAS